MTQYFKYVFIASFFSFSLALPLANAADQTQDASNSTTTDTAVVDTDAQNNKNTKPVQTSTTGTTNSTSSTSSTNNSTPNATK